MWVPLSTILVFSSSPPHFVLVILAKFRVVAIFYPHQTDTAIGSASTLYENIF